MTETSSPTSRDTTLLTLTDKKALSQRKLIILTYMRSGSSFTGDVMQKSPDVFYVYEPLYSMKIMNPLQPLIFLNKARRKSNRRSLRENIENFLTCRIWNLDLYTLTQHHLAMSNSTKDYKSCTSKKGILEIIQCMRLLRNDCAAAKVTCVKTIRFRMADAEPLLENHPRLKIVHLIRDPRGMVASQIRIGALKRGRLLRKVKVLCDTIDSDISASKKLSKTFPGRIFTLRYEDLSEEPVKMANYLYDFAGLNFTEEVKTFVKAITNAGKTEECPYCTARHNSTQTAYRWRTQSTLSYVNDIDRACVDVQREMGYLTVADEKMLKNLSYPLKTEKHYNLTTK